jgi:hypothetical protein
MKRKLPLLFCLVVMLIIIPARVIAVESSVYNKLQTPFYDPDVVTSNCGATPVVAGNLPASVLSAINALKGDYIAASEKTGVPWQLIAAVHYRESNNSPNADLQAGNPIGGPYTRFSSTYAVYGYPKTMTESAEFAARFLIEKSKVGVVNKPINVPNPDAEAIKDTLFSYNGRAQVYADQAAQLGFDPVKQPYEGSPYVMNNYDEVHKNMKIITRDFGPLDGIDTRFGAYTIYARLLGVSGGVVDCSNDGIAVGDIVQMAIKYAWPDYHEAPYLIMKPEYKAAIDAAMKRGEYVGGGQYPGIDCGGFVTRVMRDSGADPEYNKYQSNTDEQMRYLNDNPQKYQKLTNVTGIQDLEPGDIAINSTHTYFYVGDVPGFNGNSASASISFTGTGWRTPMASAASGFTEFNWYRLIR